MVRRAMCPGGGGRWPGVENRKGRLCMYPMIDKEKTGRWLKALFMVKGVRPKDIQAYLSLGCIQTVYRWLDGTNIPSMDHLYALSGLLGITVDQMVVGNKDDRAWRRRRETCSRLAGYLTRLENPEGPYSRSIKSAVTHGKVEVWR